MRLGKGLVVLFWLAALINFFSPISEFFPGFKGGSVLNWMAPFLLLMHTVEHFFFSRRFAAMEAPLDIKDRYMILVFGGFHLMTLMKRIPTTAVNQSGDQSGDQCA